MGRKILGLDTGSEINYLFSISAEEKSSLMPYATPVLVVGTENKQDLKYSANMDVTLNGADYFSSFIIDKEKVEFHHASFDGFLGSNSWISLISSSIPGNRSFSLFRG
jgi:hypothetical protein